MTNLKPVALAALLLLLGGCASTAGTRVTVVAKFANLKDVERRAIQQFVRDLRYLKGELS